MRERLTSGVPLAVLVAAVLFVLYRLFPTLLPILEVIVIGLLLGLVFRTAVSGLERLKAPPWLAVTILVAAVAAFGAFVGLVLVPNVVQEAQMLLGNAPSYLESLQNVLQGVPYVPDLSEITDRLQSYLSGLYGQIPSLFTNLLWVLGGIVAAVFLAVYSAASPDPLVSGLLRLVPEDRRDGAREFVEILGERMRGWVIGTISVALFIGVGAWLGLWILGVPLPLTFGVIAGVLNVVPYLGSTLGAALPALVALTISPFKALLVVGLFVILNQIEGNILQPLIMGRQIHAHPTMVLVSFLLLGVLLNPIVGALLAVPAAVFVGVVLEQLEKSEPSLGEDGEEEEEQGEEQQEDPKPDKSRAG